MPDSSAHIIASLREIAWLLSLRKEDFFRSRAYRKAADALARYEGDVSQLIDAGRAEDLPGIGAKTARIVGELHQTGRCQVLSDLRRRFPRDVGRMARIPGLGLARLQTLHEALGIETVEDLRRATQSQAVSGVRGFGPSTVKQIERALARLDEHPARLLLPHARQRIAQLDEVWSPILGAALAATGAVRRREAGIDRLEVLCATESPDPPVLPLVDRLEAIPGPAALPDLRGWRGTLAEGLPVTLWRVPPDRFGAALLATTGPDAFAQPALARAQVFDDERALLDSAGVAPWPPEIRWAYGEGRSPPRLVERDEVRGLVHAHTTDSDGRDGLRRLALEAKALGFEYLTVTDHSPSASYAGGVSLEDLQRQAETIRTVEADVGIRILRGTESDILGDGGLDHPLEVLERLDVVIASIHGRFRMEPEAMTERLLKTFDLPIKMIWGHPLGRLVLSRAPIEADLPRVLDRIAERGHILEVNGDPHRMDLPPEWIQTSAGARDPFCPVCRRPFRPGAANDRYGRRRRQGRWLERRRRAEHARPRCVYEGGRAAGLNRPEGPRRVGLSLRQDPVTKPG